MEFPFIVNASGGASSALIHASPSLVVPYVTWVGAVSVLGTFGNLLIIGTLVFRRRAMHCTCWPGGGASRRQPTGDVFILNLACSDLIVTAVINPFAIIGVTLGDEFFTSRPGLCQTLASVCVISCIASLLSIGCISVNRYIYICRQTSYNKIFTPAYSALMCLAVWIVAILFDLPSLIGWSQKTFDGKSHKCLWDRRKSHSYTLFLVLGGMGTPLIIIIIFYTCIFIHMSHTKAKLAQYSSAHFQCYSLFTRLMRQARMMLIIFVMFSLCWLPYISVLAFDKDDSFPLWVHLYSSLVAHTHASLNFAIYGLANRKIRQGYRHFLESQVLCCCFQHKTREAHRTPAHDLMLSPCHSDVTQDANNGSRNDHRGHALRLLLSRRSIEVRKLHEPLRGEHPNSEDGEVNKPSQDNNLIAN